MLILIILYWEKDVLSILHIQIEHFTVVVFLTWNNLLPFIFSSSCCTLDMAHSKYINHLMPSPNDEAMLSPEPEEDNSSSSGEISMVLRSADSLSSRDTNDTSSLLSVERSPARLEPSPKHVPCMTDLGTLVRRVKNVRVAYIPETCVWLGMNWCLRWLQFLPVLLASTSQEWIRKCVKLQHHTF